MNTELKEARKAQLDAIFGDFPSLEADYAMLEATQRAIDAQTVQCIDCSGRGEHVNNVNEDGDMEYEKCQTCNGRGRVRKDGV